MAKNLFNNYIWLVDTIFRAKQITFEEICEKWERNAISEGNELPLRTFHNWRKAIENMFEINIECDKRNGYSYFIENANDMAQGGIRNWLLNTFAVNNLINESHHLKRRILFEEIPSGREYLTPIIEAMRDNLMIEITYQSFWRDEPSTFVVKPYCVKVFRQRWYVVAYNEHYQSVRTYALDRIQNLYATEQKFEYPTDFDPHEYFDTCFGVTVNEDSPIETIRLKVTKDQANYLRSLPLHYTQRETETNNDYCIFEYRLKPSFELKQELLRYGQTIEVLAPQSFRDEIAQDAIAMYHKYTAQK